MFADRPQVRELSGGRLHLSHGPIDVVLRGWGEPAAVRAAYRAAARRFGDILPELCRELALLRRPMDESALLATGTTGFPSPLRGGVRCGGNPDLRRSAIPPTLSLPHKGGGDDVARTSHNSDRQLPVSPVGRRMAAACRPFADAFVTPMAAVAGSVADELLAVMLDAAELERAYVNDGGDIAVYCSPGATLDIGVAGGFGRSAAPRLNGSVRIRHGDGIGGIATSGARGRSFSLGIADSVTVLAADAANADVAATLIANAVGIDHPAIVRKPASALDPDSDLGDRLVTVSVGDLPRGAVLAALAAGRQRAAEYLARGLIVDAALMLQGETVSLSAGTTPNSGQGQHRLLQARPDSPPPMPEACLRHDGEGLGVGGTPTFDVLQSPPPCPSPTRGEGTLWHAPRLNGDRQFLLATVSQEAGPSRTQNAGRAATEGTSP